MEDKKETPPKLILKIEKPKKKYIEKVKEEFSEDGKYKLHYYKTEKGNVQKIKRKAPNNKFVYKQRLFLIYNKLSKSAAIDFVENKLNIQVDDEKKTKQIMLLYIKKYLSMQTNEEITKTLDNLELLNN